MSGKQIHLWYLAAIVVLASAASSTADGAKKRKIRPKIKPDLIYRHARIDHRKRSPYYEESESLNYVDQFFVGANLSFGDGFNEEIVLFPAVRPENKGSPKNEEIIIAEAYFRKTTDSFQLLAGRKVEFSGVAYLFRPSDLLNEDLNIFDPLEQKQGKVFTKVSWVPGNFHLDLGFIPKRANVAEQGLIWLQSGVVVGNTDLESQATYNENKGLTLGASILHFFGNNLEVHWDGRFQSKQRPSSEDFTRPFSSLEQDEASFYHVLGTRIIVRPKRSIIVEFAQNTAGLAPEEFEAFFDDRRDPQSTRDWQEQLEGRRYAFLAYRDDAIHSKLSLSIHGAINTTDSSSFGALFLGYQWSRLIKVELSPTFFTGEKNTEFGEAPYHSIVYASLKGTI